MVKETEDDLTSTTPRRRPKADVLEIGGRRLKPSTLMMGHGFDPALSEGSLGLYPAAYRRKRAPWPS